jgi:hypothetical protein
MSRSRSDWLRVNPVALPEPLRAQPFVLWRAEPRRADKPAKVPYCIATPARRASSTDPMTWGSFEDAIEAYVSLVDEPADPRRGPVGGVGVVLTKAADLACIDLDRVITEGQLDPRAHAVVARCDSWTEVSPSGAGLHIFVLGRVPRALKSDQIEVYSDARYIAVTGHQWPGTPKGLTARHGYLDHLVAAGEPARRPWTGPSAPPPDDLAGALRGRLEPWGVSAAPMRAWADGYLVELPACPWADAHTTGRGGAAVMIRASGAFDFTCLHSHCAARGWRDFRARMERAG